MLASNRSLSTMQARLFARSSASVWSKRAIFNNWFRHSGSVARAASSRHFASMSWTCTHPSARRCLARGEAALVAFNASLSIISGSFAVWR
jgi:hypothetical protein